MTFAMDNNSKFGLVAIENVYASVNSDTQLDGGTWVLGRVPVEIEANWREWVGTLRFEALQKANVVLLRSVPSVRPQILDDEHEELSRALTKMFYLLQLSGVLEYDGAHLLAGSVVDGTTQVRQMSELPPYRQTKGCTRLPVTVDRLEHAARLTKVLVEMESPRGRFKRAIRGLNVLMDGLRQMNGQERIHQFVRSLEALILPETGRTRQQFVHRCQTFAEAKPETGSIINDAFNMRSDTEHLNDWERSLQAYPKGDRENVAFQRTRQMERLACLTYSRILENASIRDHFEDEKKQRDFWTTFDNAKRRSIWGTPLDLASVELVKEYDSWDRAVPDIDNSHAT